MNKLAYIFLAVVFAACGNKQNETADTAEASAQEVLTLTPLQAKQANVTVGSLVKESINTTLKLNGKIDVPPQNMISVSAPLGGYLKSTHLLPGAHVAKGEVIAYLEDQLYVQLQQEYLVTKNALNVSQKEYERQKTLNENKATSDKVFQQTEAEYQNLRIQLKSLSEKLKLIGIQPESLNENSLSRVVPLKSPIDGYVSKVNVNIGKYVSPAEVMFELVNPTDIHLALTVFEKDVNHLFIGQKLVAYTNNNPEKKYPCDIILIGKDFGADRSVVVHCHFDSYDKSLIPGMFLQAEVNVKSHEAMVVPHDAVVHYEGKNYVFVQQAANTYNMVEVNVGVTNQTFSEIMNAEELVNKKIVTANAYTLLMALKNTEE
ncbi:MAG: efflux RND transporter periplasmic adaptor subunit [Bacteroidota bacterium]